MRSMRRPSGGAHPSMARVHQEALEVITREVARVTSLHDSTTSSTYLAQHE